MTICWEDLEGDNAFAVMGIIGGLLLQLEREVGGPRLAGVKDRYTAEAMDGDYEHLLDVSHRYAVEFLSDTLDVPETR